MGVLNDIGKKTTEVASKVAKETKLKLKTNENKSKIVDIYEEIGEKVYEKHVREENIDIKEELRRECMEIDDLAAEIEEARMEILRLNQKAQCKQCNCEIRSNDIFCSQCGKKQKEQEKTPEKEALKKLEEVEVKPRNEAKAEIIKEELIEKTEEKKSKKKE